MGAQTARYAIHYAERRLQNSIPSQCQKRTTSQQQARQQPAAQRPLGPIRAQRLPIPAPEALGQAAQPHSPPASSVSYQGRSAQQLKLRRPQHRRAAGTDVAPECQAVALPVPPAAGSQQAAAQLAAEAEDIARITTECAPGIPEREFSPQALQQPTQEHHSSEPPAEARKVWLGNIPGGVSLECSISPSPVSFAEQVSCRSTAQELSTAETGARQGAGQQRAEPGTGSGAAGGSTAGLSTADPRCSTKPAPLGGRGGSLHERTAAAEAEATRVSLAHACRPCSRSPEVGEVLGTSGNAKPPQSEGNSLAVSRGIGGAHVSNSSGAHNIAVSLSSASSSESGGTSSSGEDTDVRIGRLELKRKAELKELKELRLYKKKKAEQEGRRSSKTNKA